MQYTTILEKQISQMSLGTVQLGMNYGIANDSGQPNIAQSLNMLTTATNLGITAIDTAHEYGNSEEVLGLFLSSYKKELPFITTKFMTNLPAGSPSGEVERKIRESLEDSLRRLNLPKVNCLMLHRSTDMTQHGDVVDKTMEKLIAEGLIDMAGVSVYTEDEIDTMMMHDIYSAVQLPMNIFDHRLIDSGHIEKLRAKNILIFVRSVFFQGLFFLDPDKITDATLQKYAKEHIIALNSFAEKEGMTIAELAISYIRDIPGITSLVLGADTSAQILSNINYFNVKKISKETRAEIDSRFNDINIPEIMKVLSRKK